MADICLLCKKKIGILDKSGAKTYPGGVVCGSCVKQINRALDVYYQSIDGYTLTQLEVVYSHISELLVHRTELEKINSKYDEIIAPVKTKLRKCEFDLPALKQTIEKEYQKHRAECQRELEQLNREEGRDSNGKKVKWNAEEREMLKEQKYYIRRGMKLEADNIDAIFARQEDHYLEYIQGLAEGLKKDEESSSLILEGAEKEIEYLQMLVALNNGMRICERFVYAFNSAPAEKELFGFTGKNETQSKELADAVKIIVASIKDTLGSQTAKNYNLSELSYKQLAQMYRDYMEVMEDCDTQVVRAKGLFESQTLGLKANEVSAFWNHVQDCTPPPLDGSDASKKFLSERFPNSTPQSHITLPDTAADLLAQYDEACEELEIVTEKKQKAENLLKEMMGSNEVGTAGGRIITWKNVAQERLDSKTLKAEHPALCKKYTNKTSYRRFTIKEAS